MKKSHGKNANINKRIIYNEIAVGERAQDQVRHRIGFLSMYPTGRPSMYYADVILPGDLIPIIIGPCFCHV